MKGKIFDIQGFSVNDGPGSRTLIFMKGCTLNCFWCSNPEGISNHNIPLHYKSKCILCRNCVENCPYDAISIKEDRYFMDRQKCIKCDNKTCIESCYYDALKLNSKDYSVNEVYEIIKRDRNFWGADGGITISGGEPLMQIEFVTELLKRCYDSYIHTAIETCGNVAWQNFEKVINYLDWIFFDLKHINNERHKLATSSGNKLILENAVALSKEFKGRLIFRLPVIPRFNNDIETLSGIADFLNNFGKNEINILPLHHMGRDKYEACGLIYQGSNYQIPTNEEMIRIKMFFEDKKIKCYIGDQTPF